MQGFQATHPDMSIPCAHVTLTPYYPAGHTHGCGGPWELLEFPGQLGREAQQDICWLLTDFEVGLGVPEGEWGSVLREGPAIDMGTSFHSGDE